MCRWCFRRDVSNVSAEACISFEIRHLDSGLSFGVCTIHEAVADFHMPISSFLSQDHNHPITSTSQSRRQPQENLKMTQNTMPPTSPTNRVSKPPHKKLPRLPKGTPLTQLSHPIPPPNPKTNLPPSPDAQITKRPLPRPAIPSPYTSSSTPKTVYISTRTPFMSAVKRVEKLLNLADKRDVQAATTQAQKNKRKRKRPTNDDEEDEVMDIARGVEEGREKKRRVAGASGEQVVVKGTGKAVGKVMELGAWFLQRHEFEVRVRTGSVGAVDYFEVAEGGEDAGGDEMDVDQAEGGAEKSGDGEVEKDVEAVSGARIRYLSVLEVAVSLR